MTAGLRARALAALRDGRVEVFEAHGDPSGDEPAHSITALCRSSRTDSDRTYVIDLTPQMGWGCTCGLYGGNCVHVAAVQLVTGHESAAARGAAS